MPTQQTPLFLQWEMIKNKKVHLLDFYFGMKTTLCRTRRKDVIIFYTENRKAVTCELCLKMMVGMKGGLKLKDG
jgi:hypothetical protein